jgi:hypothetical protein
LTAIITGTVGMTLLSVGFLDPGRECVR